MPRTRVYSYTIIYLPTAVAYPGQALEEEGGVRAAVLLTSCALVAQGNFSLYAARGIMHIVLVPLLSLCCIRVPKIGSANVSWDTL